jgi:hypothetical protein
VRRPRKQRPRLDAYRNVQPWRDQSQRCGTGRIEQTKSMSEDGGSAGGVLGRSTGVDGGPTGSVLGLCASTIAAAQIIAIARAHMSRNCRIEIPPKNERTVPKRQAACRLTEVRNGPRQTTPFVLPVIRCASRRPKRRWHQHSRSISGSIETMSAGIRSHPGARACSQTNL